MSVTVGFSQATSPLIVPAPGTTKPDGTPADGSADAGGGEANLFAALLAMLTPGAQPTAETDSTATTDTPAVAVTGSTILPTTQPVVDAPVDTPVLPDLTQMQKSQQGKALLKDFTDALKAAKSALDNGEPLDPALEKKLKDTVDAIAAWFAAQPQLQPAPIDLSKLTELAAGSNILPTAPSADLPPAPAPADTDPAAPAAPVDTPEVPAPASNARTVVETVVQAQPVPAKLSELGNALKDFAAQLEKTSPELAKALAKLADRISVGDISDDAMQQLGLTRSLGSTSPELDQLVAALTSAPATKPTTTTQAAPIATPVLDVPDILAGQAEVAADAPEVKKAEVPQPEATKPETKADTTAKSDAPAKADPAPRAADVKLDADVKLEPKSADKPDDKVATTDRKPEAPAKASKPDTAAPAATPVAANTDAAAAQQGAQAAAAATTATRAIHAAYAAPVQQLNIPQVAFEVARQFEAGNTKFQIRLDPAELGRIDVKLDLDKNGTVNAHMVVERPETLDLMMRDQRALQQALQQTGLDTSKTNLEFSLRQNPFAGAGAGADTGQGGGNGGQPGFGPFGTPVIDESTELAAQTLYRGSASASGVNLFV